MIIVQCALDLNVQCVRSPQGKISITNAELDDYLFLANELNIGPLKEQCGEELARDISDEKLAHLLELAEQTNCKSTCELIHDTSIDLQTNICVCPPHLCKVTITNLMAASTYVGLRSRCGAYLAQHFRTLCVGNTLLDLPLDVVVEMLKDSELKAKGEKEVYEFILKYIDTNASTPVTVGGNDKDKGKDRVKETVVLTPSKKAMLAKLLPCVRFTRLPADFLLELDKKATEYEDVPIMHQLIHYAFKTRAVPSFFAKEKTRLKDLAAADPMFTESNRYWMYLQTIPRKYGIDVPSFTLDPNKHGKQQYKTHTYTRAYICTHTHLISFPFIVF